LRHALKGADKARSYSGDEEMFRRPAAYLSLKLRRRAKRYGGLNFLGLDDAIASACAECINSIFMVSFHLLLLSSSKRGSST
jgi:hypothetical protein